MIHWYKYRAEKKSKNWFWKIIFKLINNSVVGKTMETEDIKVIITKARRNYLVSEPNYHITTFLSKALLAREIKKISDTHE